MVTHKLEKTSGNKFQLDFAQPWIPIVSIVFVAAVLRFYQLGRESLWVDEHFSILDAQNLRFGALSRPLYFLLLRVWMQFGTSDAWLRGLSVPFSLGCVVLIYLLARRLTTESIARISASMMAISPLFIGYAQEIRMYALSTFLTLGGTLLLAIALERPSRRTIAGWSVLRLLAILTTPLNIALLLPDVLVFGWKYRHQRLWLWRFALGLLFIGALTLPSAWVLKTAGSDYMNSWASYKPKPGLMLTARVLTSFTAFWPLSDLPRPRELTLNLNEIGSGELMLLYYMAFTGLLLGLFAISLVLSLAQLRKITPSKPLLWIAAWAVLPAAFIWTLCYLASPIWWPYYLMFVAPYFLILLATAFDRIWQKYRRVAIAIAAAYAIAVGGGLIHYYTTLYHDDWRGIAQLIETNEQPGDTIALYPQDWNAEFTLPRYYQGSSPIELMRGIDGARGRKLVKASIEKMITGLPPTQGRYWIVVYYPWHFAIDTFEKTIEEQLNLVNIEIFPNSVNDAIRVFLAQPRSVNGQ